jgi:hypothetical protein
MRHFPGTGPDTTGPAALLSGLPDSASPARERRDPRVPLAIRTRCGGVPQADGNEKLVATRDKICLQREPRSARINPYRERYEHLPGGAVCRAEDNLALSGLRLAQI